MMISLIPFSRQWPLFAKLRRPIVLANLALLIWANSTLQSFADIKIIVTYTQISRHESKDVKDSRVEKSKTVILTADHNLKLTGDNNQAHEELGFETPINARDIHNSDLVLRSRIENGAIIVGAFYESYKIITTITTNGKDTCNATREYKLTPGYRYFQESAYSRPGTIERHAENVTCGISEVAN